MKSSYSPSRIESTFVLVREPKLEITLATLYQNGTLIYRAVLKSRGFEEIKSRIQTLCPNRIPFSIVKQTKIFFSS